MNGLETAKRKIKDNAAILGYDLPDNGFIMQMLELAASDGISEIVKRNYAATVRRGLITSETTKDEFIDKICEETEELGIAVLNSDKMNEREELADIALVCFAMAKHYGIDLIDEMRKKVEFNEQRQD